MNRTVEVFIAGCPACSDVVRLIRTISCSSCDVTVLDMNDPQTAERAHSIGIKSVPAVVVDGTLTPYAADGGYDEQILRAAGVGVAA